MRWFGMVSAIALSAALTSASACSNAVSPVPDVSASVDASADGPERTTLEAGSSITMRSGLRLTVPAGWVGVLKSSGSDDASVMGILGRRGATESLRLRRTVGTGELMHVSLSSAQVSEAARSGLTRVGEAGDVTVYRTNGTTSNAPTLLVAETHVRGSEYGAVLFRGKASEATTAVVEVWRLLRIEGAPVPGTSIVASDDRIGLWAKFGETPSR